MPIKKLKIHFIGIGGIGVSALAQYYLSKGHQVSGSDLVSSEITEAIKKLGAKIFIGPHNAKCLTSDVKQVVYSPAVPKDNPELKTAKKLKIKCLSYPEALGELTKKYFTIAISGTHGKSTTTAMLGLILIRAGLDPTVIIGTKLKEFKNPAPYRPAPYTKFIKIKRQQIGLGGGTGSGSNCRVGNSKYLVIEADEWQASFLNYWPKIIVLTNIEKEHLDYYKNLKNILRAFRKYISHLPDKGVLVANWDDKNIRRMLISNSKFLWTRSGLPGGLHPKFQTIKYSLRQPEVIKLKKVLKIPGEHNVFNALAALTVARALKIPDKIAFKALSEYKGSWRRFEIIKTLYPKPCTLISDYAHHPTEIKATLQAVKEKFPNQKIWCVFQPHQYQRTFYLFKEFVKVLKQAPIDKLILADIYDVAGREEREIKEKINSETLIKTINKPWAIFLKKEEIGKYLKKNLRGREVVIIMGAGDIYTLVDSFSLTRKR